MVVVLADVNLQVLPMPSFFMTLFGFLGYGTFALVSRARCNEEEHDYKDEHASTDCHVVVMCSWSR